MLLYGIEYNGSVDFLRIQILEEIEWAKEELARRLDMEDWAGAGESEDSIAQLREELEALG